MYRNSAVPEYGHRLSLKEVMPARSGHDRPLELPRLIRIHSDKARFCENASACPELLGLVYGRVAELACGAVDKRRDDLCAAAVAPQGTCETQGGRASQQGANSGADPGGSYWPHDR